MLHELEAMSGQRQQLSPSAGDVRAMGLLDRLWTALGYGRTARADALGGPPALPGPTDAVVPGVPRLVEPSGHRRDSVINDLTGLGSAGDKGAVARPNRWVLPLDDDELRALYEHNGLSRRIVELLPARATRKGWIVPECEEEDRRLKVFERVRDGWTWARLYGGSALLLVTEDDVPPSFRRRPEDWLREPLDLRRVGRLLAVHDLDAFEAVPMTYDRDPRSPGYRGPLYWSVGADGLNATVHASRVIWCRGARRPSTTRGWSVSRMPDAPVLQAVWDEVRRMTETSAGGATLAQQLYDSVMLVDGFADAMAGDEGEEFLERMKVTAQSRSSFGFTVLDAKDQFVTQSNPPSGFKDLSDAAQMMLCTVLGWPRAMLTGEAPGGLSTDDESGKERERAVISDYQERNREPLEYLYRVIYAQQDGPTGGVEPEGWRLEFCPLDEPTEKERAEVRQIVAQTDVAMINAGVYGPRDVAISRYGEEGWNLDLQPVEPPDENADEMVAAAQALLAQQPPGEDPAEGEPADEGDDEDPPPEGEDDDTEEVEREAEDRADASERSAVIWVPAADPGLRVAVERAIGQTLRAENEPHVTVYYVGELPEAGLEMAESEIVGVVVEVAADTRPSVLERGAVRAFPYNPSEGTPIVVEFDEAWMLERCNDALLRALAHLTTAKQFPRFRAHCTIGYALEPLSADALAALSTVDASAVRVPVSALVVRVGRRVLATVPVGGG